LAVIFILFIVLTMQPIYELRANAWVDGTNAIIASSGSSFAIQPDGSLWAWGNNGQGQLGDGTNVDRHTPVKIMDNAVSIESNERFTMAITNDNTLWIWGNHRFDQPEIDGVIDRYIPTKLMDDVVAVASNRDNAMAIRTDGSLWAAGINWTGLLTEDPDYTRRSSFEKIMDDVTAVTLGGSHALAVKSDGSLWTWGRNNSGQLGDNTTINRHEPMHIMDDVAFISAAGARSAAIQTNGDLWVWGTVGISIASALESDHSFEVHSPGHLFVDIRAISLSTNFKLAICTDNYLYGFGNNRFGQLGDGTTNSSSYWIEIMGNVDNAIAGEDAVISIDADGSLWAWGNNERGKIGDNTTIARPRPVVIMNEFMSIGAPMIVAAGTEPPNTTDQEEYAPNDPEAPATNEINDIELPNIELPEDFVLPDDLELPESFLPEDIELPGELELPDSLDENIMVPDTQQTTTLLLTAGAFIIILVQIVAIAISLYHLLSLNKQRQLSHQRR